MPCGGIYPVAGMGQYKCFQCDKPGCDHFVAEWDAFLHGTCVRPFLETDEGKCVLGHKHHIQVGDGVWCEEGGTLMDPNQTLKEIKELTDELADVGCADSISGPALDQVQALVNKIDSLDSWLRHGGFLPADWAKKND